MRGAWPAEPAIPRHGLGTMSFSSPGEPRHTKQAAHWCKMILLMNAIPLHASQGHFPMSSDGLFGSLQSGVLRKRRFKGNQHALTPAAEH